jgi:putative flippase GtrA
MSQNPRISNSIVAGIIASILFTFLLKPIIVFGRSFAQQRGLQVYSSLSDRIYSGAALGYRYEVERLSLAMFVGLAWGLVFGVVFLFVLNRQGARDFLRQLAHARVGRWAGSLLRVTLVVILLAYTIEFTLEATFVFASTELNASFQQRLNILGPYLSNTEKTTLISKWASMENETDYRQINTQLEEYASANNVKLPRVLWPDVLWWTMAWR